MLRLGRFSLDEFREDPAKMGWVNIEFDGEVHPVRTLSTFPNLSTVSREWIEKYQDKVWALVEEFDPGDLLILVGVAVFKDFPEGDPEFDEFSSDFPYVRLDLFTENWKRLVSDSPSGQKYAIRHVDGTEILLDRTPDAETIEIRDGVTGSRITLDADGNAEVEVDGDVRVSAGGTITLDAGELEAGVITERSIDPFTGAPHIDGSNNVIASKT